MRNRGLQNLGVEYDNINRWGWGTKNDFVVLTHEVNTKTPITIIV